MYLQKELEAMSFSTELTSTNSATSSTNPTTNAKVKISNADSIVCNDGLGFVRKLLLSTTRKSTIQVYDEVDGDRTKSKRKTLVRADKIDEEPDSMDTIISDPSSYPITIVPSSTTGGAGLLIRNSTQNLSFNRLSRISTTSK